MGEPAVAEDPRYATNAQRHAARAEIVARIAAVLKTQAARSLAAGVGGSQSARRTDLSRGRGGSRSRHCASAASSIDSSTTAARIPQVGLGIQVDGASAGIRIAPPRLGEHTEAVLSELLGYDDASGSTACARLDVDLTEIPD